MPNIKALTGVRILAAWLVFFCHFSIGILPFSIRHTLAQGYIGVTLFFVLSGYLIAYRYAGTIWTFSMYRRYMQRRFARIYPLYFIVFLLSLPMFAYFGKAMHFGGSFLLWIIMQLTFLKTFFPRLAYSGVMQSWTLGVEIVFYLLAPALIYLIKKPFGVLLVVLTGYFCCFLWVLIFGQSFWVIDHVLLGTFFGRILDLSLGVYLALHFSFKLILSDTFPWRTVVGGLGVIFSLLLLQQLSGNLWYSIYAYPGLICNHLMVPFFIVLFIYGLIKEKTILQQLLSTQLFQILGKASFAFYLLQFLVMNILFGLHKHTFYTPHSIFVILGGFIALNIISIFVYQWIEKPLYRLGTRAVK